MGNSSFQADIVMQSLPFSAKLPVDFLTTRVGRLILSFMVRLEGGQLTSKTLRRVLSEKYSIKVGDYSYGSLLDMGMCDPHTTIGPYCSIGSNVRRYGASHPMDSASTHPYFYNPSLGLVDIESDVARTPISIGPDVWIGSNVTILPGCTHIGLGAIIGAGSVVTRDVPDFAVVAGNPARMIRQRHDSDRQEMIRDSEFWTLTPAAAARLFLSL